jgi:hypothetical protein
VDGTLPQWVIFLGVEAWIPAEEVKDAYRIHQEALVAEQSSPKTKERAFDVATFCVERREGAGQAPALATALAALDRLVSYRALQ